MITFEYSSAPESKAIVKINSLYKLYIGGKFIAPKSVKSFITINPATEEVLAKVAYAEKSDVDRAVKAAQAGLKIWSKMAPAERGKYLYRIARIMQ